VVDDAPIPDATGARQPMARHIRPESGRQLRWGILAIGLSAIAVTTSVLVTALLENPVPDNAAGLADRFVNWIKLGEELDPSGPGDAEQNGYARAYSLFSDDLQARIPWIDFYQAWICLTRQHGPVMASAEDRSRWGMSRLHRSRRRFVFRLLLGSPDQFHEDMTPFSLHIGFVRQGDGFVIRDYELQPMDGER
jgi:hypothetical protein